MKLYPQQFAKRYARLDRVKALREWRAIQTDPAYTHEERCAIWTWLLHAARKGGYVVPFHPETYLITRSDEARPL
jgi:hypothetical protein